MTREEALSKWEKLGQQISDLQRERQDLKRIVLGEVLVSQRSNPYPLSPRGKRTNALEARKAICRAIKERGEASIKDLRNVTRLPDGALYGYLHALRASNIVRVEGIRGQQRYILAVHSDNEATH